ncbi:MAG: putative selenate ABC transporter substrate-binding protein [Planctomycetota bacterium]|jgi:phosphonate transport system substrate-binding protein
MRKIICLGLTAAGLLLAGCTARASEGTLRFSAIPDHGQTELKVKFDKVANYLSERLGVPVEYKPSIDYGASVEAFVNGDIEFAWYGGLTSIKAQIRVPGAEAIVCGEMDKHFRSYFVAHKDTGLKPQQEFPKEFEGMTFTFGSRESTSGRLMPEYFIRQNTGESPESFFKSVAYSGSHPATLKWVESGQVQVGAVNFGTYEDRVADKTIDPTVCVKIWETPEYYDYNITVHPDVEKKFGTGFTERLRDALIGITDPELVSAFKRKKLIPCKSSDFDAIRDVANQIGLLGKSKK